MRGGDAGRRSVLFLIVMRPVALRWGVRTVLAVLALLGLWGMHGMSPPSAGGVAVHQAAGELLEEHAPLLLAGPGLGTEPGPGGDRDDGAHIDALCGVFLAAASFGLFLLLSHAGRVAPGGLARRLPPRAVAPAAPPPPTPPPRLSALCVLRL